jgi:tetratricopeptide (TPR) repeat protein
VISNEHQHYLAHMGKANALGRLGKHQQALEVYKRVTQIDPNDKYVYQLIGQTLTTLGKHSEALENFDKCIKISGEDGTGYKLKAKSLAY